MNRFFVEKRTGTPADTLEAFGLAKLIDVLATESGLSTRLTLQDMGSVYMIDLAQSLQAEQVAQIPFLQLIQGLNTAKKQVNAPNGIDYLAHQQRNNAYFEARKKESDEQVLREQGFTPPVAEWSTWAMINQMSATAAYNGLVEIWQAHKACFAELLAIIFDLYQTMPNDWETAEATWKLMAKNHDILAKAVPQLQVVNPGKGKGGNRSKANGLSVGGLKGFWLAEYLKFVGLYQAAIPRVVSGAKDRKTYILRPKRLSWRTHQQVFPAFQKAIYAQTAIKMDVLFVLGYCQTFIEQWKAGQGSKRKFRNANPGNHIACVETIFYKHLGSAHATMNLSTLALPEWLGQQVETKPQAERFLALLDEQTRVIRRLDETHGNQYSLLGAYRHFLSGRDLAPFYQFMRGYTQHLMSQMGQRNNPPLFTTENLEVLLMAHQPKLKPILENEGFRNIAEAIRRSTVIPQGQKANGRDTLYEIRYGLGDKLIRHSQYPAEFVQELSEFIHAYSRENGRKLETRQQQYRKNITTNDIEAIVDLIDQYDAPTIANLLVAYGYARAPKTEKTDSESANEN